MTREKTIKTNDHLKQSSSADSSDEIRRRRRLAELEAIHLSEATKQGISDAKPDGTQ